MANQPRPDNRNRNVRVHDDLWAEVEALAAEHGCSTSEEVRAALLAHVAAAKAAQ